MLRLINRHNIRAYPDLVAAMHRDRKRLFIDIFGWALAHKNGEERDEFDDDNADYLILSDGRDHHIASIRLLNTERPHLLDSLFAELCEGPVPRGGDIREITRLCLPLRRRPRIEARNILARGIIDYAAAFKISSYTAVCHAGFLSELLSSGWRCTPLGFPHTAGGAPAGAVQIDMEDGAGEALASDWRCAPSAPRLSLLQSEIAA